MNKLSKEDYLEQAQEYAISQGGQCLSTEYKTAKTKMIWHCGKDNHAKWSSSFYHIVKREQWCRECYLEHSIVDNAYEKAMKFAKSHNGFVILPQGDIKNSTLLTWKCENHEHPIWKDYYNNVLKGNWCTYCTRNTIPRKISTKEDNLQKARKYAKSKGGECLSKNYENQNIHLQFQCKDKSHPPFLKCFPIIQKNNNWCKKCKFGSDEEKNKRNIRLNKAKEYAISRNGECLSTEYINSKSKLLWKCEVESHSTWLSPYTSIRAKNWCPECAGNIAQTPSELIKKAKDYAVSRGGFCVSNECLTPNDKLLWKCSENSHDLWEVSYKMINKNSWCKQCGLDSISKKQKLTDGLEKAKALAEKKGGEYLSNTYIDSHTKMLWKCSSKDHLPWRSSYANIKNGVWCPECANFIFYKENKIRKILNHILNTNFVKTRPLWNINPKTKKLLELDGYSEDKNIAFEFQGLQHYKPLYKATKEQFANLQYRDSIKKENCEKNDITLLIIDDCKELNNDKNFYDYIIKCLTHYNIKIVKPLNTIDFTKIFTSMNNYQEEALEKAQIYAKSRGGECLSTNYTNYSTQLKWKCSVDDHPFWNASMRIIYNKSWCRQCGIIEQWKKKKTTFLD